MTVFISHSFENQPEFENVTDWLDRLGVPYWRPAEIRSGASLRGQLREAVKECSVCIFLATHRSVTSSWCGAELGAFWGPGFPLLFTWRTRPCLKRRYHLFCKAMFGTESFPVWLHAPLNS
ncbi:MAG: toll/interleukin-1 receptor domain-containing protein [Pseudonocardiaceae bacterium]